VREQRKFVERLKGLRSTEASEIAEVAVILPIVFTLLLGIIFFARAYNIYSTITYAAREGAKVAVVGSGPTCATCGTPPSPAAAATAAAARIGDVLQASRIDPSQARAYTPSPAPTGGNCGAMTTSSPSVGGTGVAKVYSNAQLNPGTPGTPACGVVVSFQYPFTFFTLPFTSLDKQTVLLTAAVQMQGEN
jgi:hypothetical protein